VPPPKTNKEAVMEKRDAQTTPRPSQHDDRRENENRDSQRQGTSTAPQRSNAGQPGNQGQNPRNDSGQTSGQGDRSRDSGQTQTRHPAGATEQSGQDDDDETSSTPGGNPARGAPGGTPIPAGSPREHQQPGCEGLCPSTGGTASEAAGQTLGEPEGTEQRPL
jgi:hypothetical protein